MTPQSRFYIFITYSITETQGGVNRVNEIGKNFFVFKREYMCVKAVKNPQQGGQFWKMY